MSVNPSDPPLRLGTRGSKLARWQADWVADQLRSAGHNVELIEIRTRGDAQQSGPIGAIGIQGVFTKELQRALLENEIDLAVHSLKDLPTTPVAGLCLGAVPPREVVEDALICPGGRTASVRSVEDLPQEARVGTGSFRRRAQLLHRRPDLVIEDLRGNVDTRLRKLDEGQHDAILLASAGLLRLGLGDRITQRISTDELLPAPGQGALGIECREGDARVLATLAPLNHNASAAAVTAERTALAHLEGGCLAALGALGRVENDTLCLQVVVLREDGSARLYAEGTDRPDQASALGLKLADELIAQGARDLLRAR